MDAGEFIYLILIFIFLFVAFSRRSGKQKEEKKQSGKDVTPFPFGRGPVRELQMDSPFDMFDKRENKSDIPVKAHSPQSSSIARSSIDYVPAKEGLSSIRDSIFVDDSNLLQTESSLNRSVNPIVEALSEKNIDEWKKAFIYGEIINRKYN